LTLKTPEQIALDLIFERHGAEVRDIDKYDVRDLITAAIEADRAQRDALPDGRARFVVEFDAPAWEGATPEARALWVDSVTEVLCTEACIVNVEVGRP